MKIMRLPTFEFIRRFLMHVLPDRFHRIRHYGFLAGIRRKAKVAQIRALLGATRSDEPDRPADDPPAPLTLREPCPDCGRQMRILRSDTQYAGQRQALAQCHQCAVTGAGPPQKDRKTGPVLRSRPQRYAFKPGKIRETPTEIGDWGLHFPHSTAPTSRGFHLVRFVNAGHPAQPNLTNWPASKNLRQSGRSSCRSLFPLLVFPNWPSETNHRIKGSGSTKPEPIS